MLRDEFAIPPGIAYLAGNSLGPLPRAAERAVAEELSRWEHLGVEAWFDGEVRWLDAAGRLRAPLARLIGAQEDEVVVMNSLTVNLHLLLATFYRPGRGRTRIVVEDTAFPSDVYALASQVRGHGLDPREEIVRADSDELADAIAREGERLGLVWLGAVNYLTGARLDVSGLTAAAHRVGARAGWDLAHAVGNVPIDLDEAGVDFAVWCHYKYLNAGPGAPGGAYVNARHLASGPGLHGCWGVGEVERFRMEPEFHGGPTAEGWAVSTPSILALAPLAASLEQFDRIGLDALRARSVALTAHLEAQLDDVGADMITPRDPDERGCQLSIRVRDAAAVTARLRADHGVTADSRPPDVVRLAPVALYNTEEDCDRAATALSRQ
jgi:kynureninase